MESELQAISEQAGVIWASIMGQLRNFTLPSRYNQIIILLVGLIIVRALRNPFGNRFRAWMHGLEGWPKWRLRVLLMFEQRLGLILFTSFAWAATFTMWGVSRFPSRSFLLELVATMTTAILLVSFATRLVKNKFLRQIITWVCGPM